MKFKDRITDKWSLECKDDYQSIKDKVIFNERDTPQRKMLFNQMIFSSVTIIVLIILAIPFLINNLNNKLNDPGMDYDGVMNGNVGGDKEDDLANKDENAEGDVPSSNKPGSEKDLEEELFLENIEKGVLIADFIETITYFDLNNDKNVVIKDNSKIVEYFNSLEISIFQGNVELDIEHQLMINDDCANIFFGNNQFITMGYGDKYIVFMTNSDNVLVDILEYLK